MTKALRKNTRRSISGSLGRYIAILLIIMLGVAFLTGLRDTRPIMSATETAYVKNTKLYDLRLISTIGFDADDVAAVQKADGVVAAAGSVNADFIWQHDNKERVYRAHMLTDNINEPVLTAGRMPENGSECLIDSSRFSEGMIGQTIEISDSNDEDTKKNFKYSTYTVVGLADSPLYIHTLRGTTSLGDGTLQGFVLIPEDGFDFEYYTLPAPMNSRYTATPTTITSIRSPILSKPPPPLPSTRVLIVSRPTAKPKFQTPRTN